MTISSTTIVVGQQNKFDIGLEGGPSLTFLRGNELLEKFNEPKVSFMGGLSFQYNFPKIISIRTGFAFERKGAVAKGTMLDINGNNIGNFTTHSNFEYLTAPILVRAALGNKMKFFINAGPFFSYLIKQTFVSQGTNIPKTVGDNSNLDKPFDMGITAGLGVAIPLKEKFSFSCEIRNNLGLYNVSEVPIYNNGSIKTNSTNLLIGFAYKIGSRNTETK